MRHHVPPGDSVNRRFRRIVMVVYLVVLVLVLWLCAEQWRGYADAAEARREFVVVQAALRAMADISTERRPNFVVIMRSGAASDEERAALEVARRATDARLVELDTTLRNPHCRACPSLRARANPIRPALEAARRELDALGAMPPSEQRNETILAAFNHMVDVIPQLSAIAERAATGVIRENAHVQSYLLAARLAALLREHAGRLASQFVPALATHRALTPNEVFDIARTRGRIEQLRDLLSPSIRNLPPYLQADYAEVERSYFGSSLDHMDKLRAEAMAPGGAATTPEQLTVRYRPSVEPINRFRDEALALAGKTIRDSLHWHLWLLIGAALFAWLMTGVLVLAMWRFREKIVRPFVEARRLILAIASGRLGIAIPQEAYSGEVRDMFGALAVLKRNSEERLRLEQERKRLIEELRTMAETDPLTGLLNRRSFESRARLLIKNRRRNEPYLSLIMLDIDHFKRVNDTYGHETGDRALIHLAALCRETSRTEDVVARTGGEEFVLLLRVHEPAEAIALAQRLRGRLHQDTIVAFDGEVFGITASFGVASMPRADSHQLDELLRQADALLYRAKAAGRDRIESALLA